MVDMNQKGSHLCREKHVIVRDFNGEMETMRDLICTRFDSLPSSFIEQCINKKGLFHRLDLWLMQQILAACLLLVVLQTFRQGYNARLNCFFFLTPSMYITQ